MIDFYRDYCEIVIEKPKVIIPVLKGEFWSNKQRSSLNIHQIPYMACFKADLPRFFIEKYSEPNDFVFDPFMGRGTTLLEAALLGRNVIGSDCGALSRFYIKTRLNPPTTKEVQERLSELDLKHHVEDDDELLVFFHKDTLSEIYALRSLSSKDFVDDWIKMVALTRLTGHSRGFFSVYSLPPNSQATVKSQIKINEKKKQIPEYRDVKKLILKKSKSLLRGLNEDFKRNLNNAKSSFYSLDSRDLNKIKDSSVDLIITSPPFLNTIDYKKNNWLKNWFLNIKDYNPCQTSSLNDWNDFMTESLIEMKRILKNDKFCCIEVGEVKKGKINLELEVIKNGLRAGLFPVKVYHHIANFTKTSNIWGVDNMKKGTNSNRVVVFQKR